MKAKNSKLFIEACILIIFASFSHFSFAAVGLPAQPDYTPLIGIPGITDGGGLNKDTSLPEYINKIYFLLIAVGGMIAVVRIVLAGVKYSLSDVVTNKGEAKEDIKGVLLGLALLLLPWVVLNTIYPQLTNLDILRGAKDLPTNGRALQQVQNIPLSDAQKLEAGTEVDLCKHEGVTRAKEACDKKCTDRPGGIIDTKHQNTDMTRCIYPSNDTPKNPTGELKPLSEAQSLERLKCFREGSESCDPGVAAPKSEEERKSFCALGGGVWGANGCVSNLADEKTVVTVPTNDPRVKELAEQWPGICKNIEAQSREYPIGGYTTFMCIK